MEAGSSADPGIGFVLEEAIDEVIGFVFRDADVEIGFVSESAAGDLASSFHGAFGRGGTPLVTWKVYGSCFVASVGLRPMVADKRGPGGSRIEAEGRCREAVPDRRCQAILP